MSVNPVESKIWGSLFGTDEMRELFSDRAQLQLMLDVEAALARAEASLGLVPAEIAEAIGGAARVERISVESIAESTGRAGYPVAGLVKELGRAAGDEAARYIHLGASTQDIVDTALVMQIRQALRYILRDLVELARSLADSAKRYRDTPMAGRTHLQHAVPITFGFKCAVWAAPLIDHLERLDQASRRILVVQLGGAAGTLSVLGAQGPAVVEALARELGLGVADLPWHVLRDGIAEMAALLGLICGSLSKFALDVSLMAQTEVAEISEPHEAGRGGSSTMPQKRNPTASEYILAAVRGVNALVPMVFAAMTQDHERSTGAWQSEALALPQCFALTAGALVHARVIAAGMRVDAGRMRQNLDAQSGLIMAESVAAALTPKMGRAAAHDAVARACDAAISQRRMLRDVMLDDPAIRAHLANEELERVTDPASYLGSAGIFVDRVVARITALT